MKNEIYKSACFEIQYCQKNQNLPFILESNLDLVKSRCNYTARSVFTKEQPKSLSRHKTFPQCQVPSQSISSLSFHRSFPNLFHHSLSCLFDLFIYHQSIPHSLNYLDLYCLGVRQCTFSKLVLNFKYFQAMLGPLHFLLNILITLQNAI